MDCTAAFSLQTVGIAPDPAVASHAQRLFAALAAWDTGGTWPNFSPPHDPVSARRAYDEVTLARLAAVAERYDPDGVLAGGAFATPSRTRLRDLMATGRPPTPASRPRRHAGPTVTLARDRVAALPVCPPTCGILTACPSPAQCRRRAAIGPL